MAEAKRDMSFREYVSWRRFFGARPWGEAEALQAWAAFASTGRAKRNLSLQDFMPKAPKQYSAQAFYDEMRRWSDKVEGMVSG